MMWRAHHDRIESLGRHHPEQAFLSSFRLFRIQHESNVSQVRIPRKNRAIMGPFRDTAGQLFQCPIRIADESLLR
jgi:hypothetical protein